MTADDAAKAKAYWASTELQGKEYVKPPFYAQALAHVIQRLAPRSVLEMGCNAGRNLQLLREALPATTTLRGFDINAQSIELGRAKWGLALDVADEDYLSREPAGAVDVLFTVSVLDHLPAIDRVLLDIARVVRGYYLAIEPWPEDDLRYLDVFKRDGRVRAAVTTETPYSYLHAYDRLVPPAGLHPRLDVPMPPYAANWGPLYRLTVYEKPGTPAPPVSWDQLRDELMFAAVRATK